jgi:hypothetical protein
MSCVDVSPTDSDSARSRRESVDALDCESIKRGNRCVERAKLIVNALKVIAYTIPCCGVVGGSIREGEVS